MSFRKTFIAALSALALVSSIGSSAFAQDAAPMDHGKMNHDPASTTGMAGMSAPDGDQGPSSQAFAKAGAAMHEAMSKPYTGNPDVDFVTGMIAHHQGAIAMARVELDYGKDPDLRTLAEAIIKAQEGEIVMMKAWLAKNGG